jgi:alkanesulfonate monooxygenase SsuD/methylene tetrahydromethanopterin reductase-like flavin-dependent oxidoreductase (luciferase family)
VLLSALRRGMEKAGRSPGSVEVSRPVFMVMGDDDKDRADRLQQARRQLAFYASTPAYRPVLAAVGLEYLQPRLSDLVRDQRWEAMADLVDDDFLRHFVVVGTPEQMPALTRAHLPTFVTATSAYGGWPVDDENRLAAILDTFRST